MPWCQQKGYRIMLSPRRGRIDKEVEAGATYTQSVMQCILPALPAHLGITSGAESPCAQELRSRNPLSSRPNKSTNAPTALTHFRIKTNTIRLLAKGDQIHWQHEYQQAGTAEGPPLEWRNARPVQTADGIA
jgi:hypothetical protein